MAELLMMNVRIAATPVVLAASWLGFASSAAAHIALVDPPARYDRSFVKDGPCGRADNPPGEVTTTYEAGQTIVVSFDEFIDHPGHYRVSLSAEGDGAFVDPTDYDDFYPAENVLLDEIEDPAVTVHEVEVKLPDGLTCERCVLQVLQIMYDKMPWGPAGGNEIYYQCADITIVPVGAGEGDTGTGESSSGGGEESTESTSSATPPPGESTSSTTGSESESEGSSETTSVPGVETNKDEGGCACAATPASGRSNGLLAMIVGLPLALRRRSATRRDRARLAAPSNG